MRITYRVPESSTPHTGYVLRVYDCLHRFLVREADNTTRLVDLCQIVGTKTLKMRS